jgi:hypothetical protein
MDMSDVYPDVLGDAVSHSSQRLAQLGSLVTAAATMEVRRRAQANALKAARDEREFRALREQELAARQLARAEWAPAHNSRWLAQADLVQAMRVWAAAAGCADDDPAALPALRKCEERLRSCIRMRWRGTTGFVGRESGWLRRCVGRCRCLAGRRTRGLRTPRSCVRCWKVPVGLMSRRVVAMRACRTNGTRAQVTSTIWAAGWRRDWRRKASRVRPPKRS